MLKSLKNLRDAVAAFFIYYLIITLFSTNFIATAYVICCTRYWLIATIYVVWIVWDRKTPERGGRRNEWLCSWRIFQYVKQYFPITISVVPGVELDPKRNYLLCAFPHGFIPIGVSIAIQSNACNARELFPNHTAYGMTLNVFFYCPLLREYALSLGLCNANPASIEYLLNYPNGGKIAGLTVGGTTEMYYCHGGQYRLNLKNRKGFVKIALRNGSPLIPVFSFGETSLVDQVVFKNGTLIRAFQDFLKRNLGATYLFVYGQSLFSGKIGLIPKKKPVNVVVGLPIQVEKIINPTQHDIDALHQTFITKLTELFEEYKWHYEEYPEKTFLTIA